MKLFHVCNEYPINLSDKNQYYSVAGIVANSIPYQFSVILNDYERILTEVEMQPNATQAQPEKRTQNNLK